MYWQTLMGDKAARVGDYKWVETKFYRGLFDLRKDPGEQHDLSTSRPELLAELRGQFLGQLDAEVGEEAPADVLRAVDEDSLVRGGHGT